MGELQLLISWLVCVIFLSKSYFSERRVRELSISK